MQAEQAQIIIIDHGTSARRRLPRWQVNLSDGERVWGKQRFDSPSDAFGYVMQLRADGHTMVSQSAYIELLEEHVVRLRMSRTEIIRTIIEETLKFVQSQQFVTAA